MQNWTFDETEVRGCLEDMMAAMPNLAGKLGPGRHIYYGQRIDMEPACRGGGASSPPYVPPLTTREGMQEGEEDAAGKRSCMPPPTMPPLDRCNRNGGARTGRPTTRR